MKKVTKLFATFHCPGLFFAEPVIKEVDTIDPRLIKDIPKNAYSVQFWSREYAIDDDGKEYQGERKNLHSHNIFLGGTLFTPEQINKLPGNNRILHDNIVNNHYTHGIKCRTENWQGFKDGQDIIIPESELDFQNETT